MPELPEVETIRRSLVDKVIGRRIKEVEYLLSRLVKWPSAGEFQAVLTSRTIVDLTRRGKYLLFHLDDKQIMIVHLRMTGRLSYVEPGMEIDKFARILFKLDNGDCLIYGDTRTLGTLYLLPPEELWRISGLANMGPEPLSTEFSISYFTEMLKKRHGNIKAVLLNQKYIGGLGNIYVDESMAIAGIHPERIASSLTVEEVEGLFHAINKVIEDGITHGGTTFRDYRDGGGNKGNHQHHLAVYGRKAAPCFTCGTPIVWKTVAGRGTHFCPDCQK